MFTQKSFLFTLFLNKCCVSISKSSTEPSVYYSKYYEKKVPTLHHFVKKYFLFVLNIIEIQQNVKFMSLKIPKVFHPYNTALKAIKVPQHIWNYVSTCLMSAKEIFFSIFIASNPKEGTTLKYAKIKVKC